MRKFVCILLCITSAVFMATGVFASSNTELVTYTLSYDEMNTLLSSSLCLLTVTDMSTGGTDNSFQLDVSRRVDLDNDYLYFSTDSFPTGSQYKLTFGFVYPGSISSPIVSELYSLDVDSVVFLSSSSLSSSTNVPTISFTPSFSRDDSSLVPFTSSNQSTSYNYSVTLGNGTTLNSTRFTSTFTPNVTPVSFYAYVLTSIKPASMGVGSTPYIYLGIKPFTFTAPDDTVNEIVSAIEDLKQNIDKNTQDIIDNQNKNQEQLEDFLGTPSSDDDAALSELDSNISSSEDKMNVVQDALDSVDEPNLDEFDFDITNNDYYDSTIVSSFQSLISNSLIINMLLIVVMVIFIAYILFGKLS